MKPPSETWDYFFVIFCCILVTNVKLQISGIFETMFHFCFICFTFVSKNSSLKNGTKKFIVTTFSTLETFL